MNQTGPIRAIRHVAVLYHPKIQQSHDVAESVCRWLAEQQITAWPALTWDETAIRPRIPDMDLVIVLGGDGSMLRAARMAAGYDIPLLGINMGRLGFLSELSPSNWEAQLPHVLTGEYWIEQRLMIRARTWRGSDLIGDHLALNDVVISRGSLARVVRLRTRIDGNLLTTYVADGVIVSTPTGSTAYALAAGGPILPPELRNMLLLPIAPHMSLNRPIVLARDATVKIGVRTDHQAILTVDGQFEVELESGDEIEVSSADHTSLFIRLGSRAYFYDTLLARMAPKPVADEY